MNRKLISFSLILLTLLTVAALAMWFETLQVNVAVGTGEVDWEILPPAIWLDKCGSGDKDWNASVPRPQQLNKDVGCTDVELIDSDGDEDYDTMKVTLYNVYPWYYTHIAFKVHNDGTIPIKIWRIIIDGREFYKLNEQELQQGVELDLTGDGKSDVLIWWGDNFGVQLHPCQSADISFDITVLQDAPQGSTLSFTISFEAIQWNEYYVPS